MLYVTAITKATFAFVDQGVAQRIPPSPVFGRDRHVDDNPRRSTVEDFQVAPLIPCAGITLVGSAHPVEAATSMSVRLGVYRDDEPLIEKTLYVFGERSAENPHTSGILGRTPLIYERAAAGPLNLAGSALFSVAHATDPALPGCFGPVPLAWRARVFGRRALDPATMKASPMEIPSGFDFMFFSSAPADQRVASLRGDEWIILDGLSPQASRTQTQLPSARGRARFEIEGAQGRRTVESELALDTVGIDSDRGMMSLVFRGHVAIDESATKVMVHAGIETPDELFSGPPAHATVTRTTSPTGAARPSMPARRAEPEDLSARDLSAGDDEDGDRGATVVAKLSDVRGPALPFRSMPQGTPFVRSAMGDEAPRFQPTSTADALPSVAVPSSIPATEPELTPMRRRDRRPAPIAATPWDRPRPPPPPRRQTLDETMTLTRSSTMAESGLPSGGLPFVPTSASPGSAAIRSTLPSAVDLPRTPPEPDASRSAAPPHAMPAHRFDRTGSGDVTAIDIDPEQIRAGRAAAAALTPPAPSPPSSTPPAPRPPSSPAPARSEPPPALAVEDFDRTMVRASPPELAIDPPRESITETARAAPDVTPPPVAAEAPLAVDEVEPEPSVEKAPTLRDRVEAAARSGENLADFELVSADLTAVDLAGRDLTGVDLAGANLSFARLAGATLDRANLERTNLEGADLSGASMRGTVLRGASGVRANFGGAQLDEADLRMSKFAGANFDGASLTSAQAARADLTGVNLCRSNLSSANFRTARLAESRFVDATVDKADFRDALLTRADFTRVDRSSARFQGANVDGMTT